ncbi:MAG: flippase [Nitrospinaceae bacterium]|jgi:O-antigen/teichoic acid export membrane protein
MSLARSFSLQWIASAYSAIISILLTFLYARLLGPETFGNYNYLLTLAALYAILQDGGFRTLIFRELTSPSFQNLKDHLVSIALGNNFLITIIGTLLLLSSPIKDSFLLALAIFSFGLVTTVTIFSSEFKGKGNFSADAQWRIISRTLGAIGSVVFILLFSPTIQWVFGGAIIGYSIALILRPATCKLKIIFKKLDSVVYRSLASLLIIDIATLIYFKIDIVMLRHIGNGLEEVGFYSAGSRFIEGLIMVHLPFATVLFREIRKRANHPNKVKSYILKLFFFGSASPIIIVPVCWYFSNEILRLCYGVDFANASPLFELLLISFFFMIPNLVLTQATLALDQEYYYAKVTCLAALINIGLNFYLIPTMGAKGAAIGTIVTESFLVILIGGGIYMWNKKSGHKIETL